MNNDPDNKSKKQPVIRKFSHSRQFYDRQKTLNAYDRIDASAPPADVENVLSTIEKLDNNTRAMLIEAMGNLNRDQAVSDVATARNGEDFEPVEIGDKVNIVGGQFGMIGSSGTVKRVGRTRAHVTVPVIGRKQPRTVYVWLSELERAKPLPIN